MRDNLRRYSLWQMRDFGRDQPSVADEGHGIAAVRVHGPLRGKRGGRRQLGIKGLFVHSQRGSQKQSTYSGIQAITMPHDRMLATRYTYTWINKYIFPGGFLPSAQVIDEVTAKHTSLRVVDRLAFGADYAETLRRWDDAFLAHSAEVLQLGFDETFLRMWHFYLEYSRAGFAAGYIDVGNVWGEDEKVRFDSLRASAGVGLSWVSPVGPLKLSYGTPIRKKPEDRIQRLQFQIGTAF